MFIIGLTGIARTTCIETTGKMPVANHVPNLCLHHQRQDRAGYGGVERETRQYLQGRAVSRANRPQPIQKIQKLEIRRIVIEFTYNLTYAIPTYNRINTKDCNMARKFVKAGLHAETLRFGYLRWPDIKTHVTICLSECKFIAANWFWLLSNEV